MCSSLVVETVGRNCAAAAAASGYLPAVHSEASRMSRSLIHIRVQKGDCRRNELHARGRSTGEC